MTIVALAPPRLAPIPDVLEAAEELLALARSGEIDGLVWAASYTDDRTGQTRRAGKAGPSLVGSVALLQARLIQDVLA